MSDDKDNGYAWVRLWHKSGVDVRIPLTANMPPVYAVGLLASVDTLLAAGWLTNAPGLEVGEEREEIGWVCRLDHEKDGDTTPTVLLYSTNNQLTYSFIRKYMNTPDEVAAFEHASGMKYASMPAYPGNDHPERGASPKTDKFIVKASRPFGLVWKPNPRYKDAPAGQDTRSLAEKRKRDFVRWHDSKPAETPKVESVKPEPEKPAVNGTKKKTTIEAIMECKDHSILDGAEKKALALTVDKGQPILNAILERRAWLILEAAGHAKTPEEADAAEDLMLKYKLRDTEYERDIVNAIKIARAGFPKVAK